MLWSGLMNAKKKKGSASCAVDVEFAAVLKGKEDYMRKAKFSHAFTAGDSTTRGFKNLFKTTWAAFIADQ